MLNAPSIEPGLAGFLVCLAGELTGGLICGDVPRHQPIFLMDFPRNKPSIFGVPQFTETPSYVVFHWDYYQGTR
jgi:hypothetical protein